MPPKNKVFVIIGNKHAGKSTLTNGILNRAVKGRGNHKGETQVIYVPAGSTALQRTRLPTISKVTFRRKQIVVIDSPGKESLKAANVLAQDFLRRKSYQQVDVLLLVVDASSLVIFPYLSWIWSPYLDKTKIEELTTILPEFSAPSSPYVLLTHCDRFEQGTGDCPPSLLVDITTQLRAAAVNVLKVAKTCDWSNASCKSKTCGHNYTQQSMDVCGEILEAAFRVELTAASDSSSDLSS